MTDNGNSTTAEAEADVDAPATPGEAITGMIREARRRAALRYYVTVDGVGYNDEAQALFGVDEHGVPRAEGLTDEGVEFADGIADTFDSLGRGEQAARERHEEIEREREAGARDLPGAFAGAFVRDLGLAGPIRAALRSAAVSFAAALDDGASDDGHGHAGGDPHAPACVGHHDDGSTTVRLPAGGYVILQVTPPREGEGEFPVGMIAIAAGGGVRHARQADVPDDAEGAERMSIEKALSIAQAALDAYTEQRPGVAFGEHDGELPDEVRERAEELLRSVFGPGVGNVRGRQFGRRGGEGGAADEAPGGRPDPGDVGPGDAGFVAAPEPVELRDYAGNSGPGFPVSTPDAGPQCDTGSAAPTSSPAGGAGAATPTSTSDTSTSDSSSGASSGGGE